MKLCFLFGDLDKFKGDGCMWKGNGVVDNDGYIFLEMSDNKRMVVENVETY